MFAIYLALMICTLIPVAAMQAGADPSLLTWVVFALVVVKASLLVDHFMEMRKAPVGWRFATQAWAPVVVLALAVIHWVN